MKPTPSLFTAQVAGTVEAVAALLKIDAMKPYASLPIDPSTLKGNITGKLGVGLRLGPVMKPKDTELTIDANATNLTADHLVGKELLKMRPSMFSSARAVCRQKGRAASTTRRRRSTSKNRSISRPLPRSASSLTMRPAPNKGSEAFPM